MWLLLSHLFVTLILWLGTHFVWEAVNRDVHVFMCIDPILKLVPGNQE